MATYISISFPTYVYRGETTTITASCDELPSTYSYYRLYTYTSGTYASYGSVSPTYSSTFYSKGKMSASISLASTNTSSTMRYCYVYVVLQGSNSSTFSTTYTVETKSGYIGWGNTRSSQSWTISPTSVTLNPGGTQSITRSGTAYGTVTYRTSNSSVATVSSGTITAVAAGSATITVYAAGNTSYKPRSQTCAVTVSKSDQTWTLTAQTLTYPTAKTFTISGTQGTVTAKYYSGTQCAKIEVSSTATIELTPYAYTSDNVTGYYQVTAAGNSSYNSRTQYFYVYVNRGQPTITTAPAVRSLTWNDSQQSLLTSGVVTGGTMYYATGTTTTPGTWSTSIPTGKDAGTYYMWRKVVGSTGYKDIAQAYLGGTTITRATVTYPTVTNTALTYAINSSTGAGAAQGPTITNQSEYLTKGGTYSATNVGSYSVTFTPDSNHKWSDGTTAAKSTSWTIGAVRRFYVGSDTVIPYINSDLYRAYIYDSNGWHILNT